MSENQPEYVPNQVELINQELQNRIGQITTSYEYQLASLKAQATLEIQARDKRIDELNRELARAAAEKAQKDYANSNPN